MMKRLTFILLMVYLLFPMRAMCQEGELLDIITTQLSPTDFQINISLARESRRGLFHLLRAVNDDTLSEVSSFSLLNFSVSDTTIVNRLPHPLRCSDSVRYQVVPHWLLSYSNITTTVNNDNTPTSPTQQGVATVDEDSQKILLTWDPNPDTDIMGYYICKGSPCLDYDTVWGRFNNTYTCQDLTPLEQYTFRVLAFDSCMNPSPLTDPFGNMVLALDGQDCSSTLRFSWNAYEGMVGNVDYYQVQVRYDDDPQWHEIQTLTATTSQLNVPQDVSRLWLRVLAKNAQYQASSNIVYYQFSTADSAKYLYISHASVQPDGRSVHLGFYVDPDFQSSGYRLYRAVGNGSFGLIATIPYAARQRFDYLDENVLADRQVVRYRLSSLDGCGRNEKYSDVVATMLLDVTDLGLGVQLQWIPYEGWESLEGYTIWRRTQSESSWNQLAQVGSVTGYLDDLSAQAAPTEALYYRVMAQESATSRYGLADTAYSAEALYKRDATIYFPNAFTPGQADNNTFGPSYTFIDMEDYELNIYDRNGELLFTTRNPAERWDGTSRGRILPQGTYVYSAKCHTLNHHLRQRTGTVLLIR